MILNIKEILYANTDIPLFQYKRISCQLYIADCATEPGYTNANFIKDKMGKERKAVCKLHHVSVMHRFLYNRRVSHTNYFFFQLLFYK